MEIRSLGSSGFEVTAFIYGAGSIGGVGSAIDTRGLGIDAEQGMGRQPIDEQCLGYLDERRPFPA